MRPASLPVGRSRDVAMSLRIRLEDKPDRCHNSGHPAVAGG